jgi:hypothetical protein
MRPCTNSNDTVPCTEQSLRKGLTSLGAIYFGHPSFSNALTVPWDTSGSCEMGEMMMELNWSYITAGILWLCVYGASLSFDAPSIIFGGLTILEETHHAMYSRAGMCIVDAAVPCDTADESVSQSVRSRALSPCQGTESSSNASGCYAASRAAVCGQLERVEANPGSAGDAERVMQAGCVVMKCLEEGAAVARECISTQCLSCASEDACLRCSSVRFDSWSGWSAVGRDTPTSKRQRQS